MRKQQLALALARLFEGPAGQRDTTFHNADQLALTSLISFAIGASIGRIGDKMGCKSRAWLMLGTFIQALFTMSAALTIWKSGSASVADSRGDPLWTDALSFACVSFLSLSLGLQGIMGKRVNTQFTTTSAFARIFSPRYVYLTFIIFFFNSCVNNNLVRTHVRPQSLPTALCPFTRPQDICHRHPFRWRVCWPLHD
jgi:hypothetical protein